jgi:hypothetical protein
MWFDIVFAAPQDASRALGIMSMKGKAIWWEDCAVRRVDNLSPYQVTVKDDWERKYHEKYPVIGKLIGMGEDLSLLTLPADAMLPHED